MKSFITGIDGFIGAHLSEKLLASGDQVIGISRKISLKQKNLIIYQANLDQKTRVTKIIKDHQPDRLFHLAAQSNILQSFKAPQPTIETNVNGTLTLLEAIRWHTPQTRFISVGSSAEYGLTALDHKILTEELPLQPSNPYGVSKTAQGMFARLYARAYHLSIIHVRPFAVIGIGKTGDAISDFCRGIVAIERDQKTELSVGNLKVRRDFIDVRDCVTALVIVSKKGRLSEVYNICNGRSASLNDILNILKQAARKPFDIATGSKPSRPADDPRLVGSIKKLFKLGYRPRYELKETVVDTLNYWRKN